MNLQGKLLTYQVPENGKIGAPPKAGPFFFLSNAKNYVAECFGVCECEL